VTASPVDARRLRTEPELLAIAKQLPVPVLAEARHEELRTAFLAGVSAGSAGSVGSVDCRSTKRTRTGLAVQGRQRLLLVAAILLAGAGIAAAAWRIKTRAAPAPGQVEAAASTSGGKARGLRGRGGGEPSEASELGPVAAASLVAPSLASSSPAPSAPAEERGAPARSTRRVAVVTSAAARTAARTAARESQADVEIAFARGWRALRTNDFEAAAQAFGQAASEGDGNALSEDASFWRGVALDRANRPAESQEALTRFLVRYPKSDRAGEAAVMLGWLLLRAGEVTGADARFGSALGDPSERVRRSARAGLTASGRGRAH